MSREPNNMINVSQKLTEVLSDIGVNEKTVLKRRRQILLQETMETIYYRLLEKPMSVFHFGSQSEGSTTVSLNSDTDVLICDHRYLVIQEWKEWEHGKMNLLMVQDEGISPGYCLLQRLRDTEPLPFPPFVPIYGDRQKQLFSTDRRGRLVMKSSYSDAIILNTFTPVVKNGPASSSGGQLGFADQDCVPAYHCKSWPVEAEPWLLRQGVGGWPTEEMKKHCESTGCFVVAVSSKSGRNDDIEWRVSTSQAERCLMFSLNITQLSCYILMKMILKTFINPQFNGVISSFMCKTVLFHCIHNTHPGEWQQHTLLESLKRCLVKLQNCVRNSQCPHFIIPGNNLMAGRISVPVKQGLLEILQRVIQSDGRDLLQIPFDELGVRLGLKMSKVGVYLDTDSCMSPEFVPSIVSEELMLNTGRQLCSCVNGVVLFGKKQPMRQRIETCLLDLVTNYKSANCTSYSKAASRLLIPPLCATLGSIKASHEISTNCTISKVSEGLLSIGLNSDVLSGRLKLASALYCSGKMEEAERVVRYAEGKMDQNKAEPICLCREYRVQPILRPEFLQKCNTGNEDVIKHIIAFCVRFTKSEINCVPHELQYEMFKSTKGDLQYKGQSYELFGFSTNWAHVDSLPYLYFLQYKIYRHLQRPVGQQCALEYLSSVIDKATNLGHRETALNLLGQCMEQENRHNDALKCYVKSLNIRPRNNAAKIHICRILNLLVNTDGPTKS